MVTRAAAIVVDKKMIRYTFTSAVAAAAAGDGGGGGGGCASASALLSPSSLSLTDTLSAYLRTNRLPGHWPQQVNERSGGDTLHQLT